ncbi:hypothetical protein [Nostoc linckia]|nr:hypothetical protein [Nostoc linckia]
MSAVVKIHLFEPQFLVGANNRSGQTTLRGEQPFGANNRSPLQGGLFT